MVFIQPDSFKRDKQNYYKFRPDTDTKQYVDKKFDNNGYTTNLILNMGTNQHLKNTPIQNSDKTDRGVVARSLTQYNGRTDPILPNYKKDLRAWSIIC